LDLTVASMLTVDGVTNGAVYALIAMATILVFAVTRVLFIAQGEFVVFGAMTMAQLATGRVPSTVWLLGILLLASVVQEVIAATKRRSSIKGLTLALLRLYAVPVVAGGATLVLAPMKPPLIVQALLSLALVAPMGALVYRLVYRSISASSVLTLLIVSVGVHFALVGLGLIFFGPEGYRTPAFVDASVELGSVPIAGQAILVVGVSVALIAALYWLFTFTFRGMALRATAVNQLGARIVGLSAERAGQTSFLLAAGIGALSGLLIGPTTTLYYDTGFLIGLKGFVAAVFAGLASFPGALAGALVVGMLESFGSFWSSAFKESIVFGAVIPILLWRSLLNRSGEEH
jgi:branched-chain amino acid transport system permease protein